MDNSASQFSETLGFWLPPDPASSNIGYRHGIGNGGAALEAWWSLAKVGKVKRCVLQTRSSQQVPPSNMNDRSESGEPRGRFSSSRLISPRNSALLLIDAQQKLLPAIESREKLLFNISRLARCADLLDVRRSATVQYSKGLGPLDASLQPFFADPEDKLDFSAAACENVIRDWQEASLSQVVLVGIETHICVLQSALDFLALQFDVFVVADAVAARGEYDHSMGLQRMQAEGASIVTTESVMFEWCESATNSNFRQVSAIVRETLANQ